MQIIALFYPRERNSSSSKAVKQAVRSSGEGRRREWGEPSGTGSNCPPGSRDRSNISCSSVWPATTWGVTKREMDFISHKGHKVKDSGGEIECKNENTVYCATNYDL